MSPSTATTGREVAPPSKRYYSLYSLPHVCTLPEERRPRCGKQVTRPVRRYAGELVSPMLWLPPVLRKQDQGGRRFYERHRGWDWEQEGITCMGDESPSGDLLHPVKDLATHDALRQKRGKWRVSLGGFNVIIEDGQTREIVHPTYIPIPSSVPVLNNQLLMSIS